MSSDSSADSVSAIAVSGLQFHYGERRALAGLTFAVERGTIFGLLGPNGGGKTTLFRILSTLLPIQSGQARVLGLDVGRHPDAVRRRIGVTFQSPSLDGKLTVLENLLHHGRLYGNWGRSLRVRCLQLLEQVRLADRLNDPAETLSGGQKRRVEIAKGLMHYPELLLLDEPSTGLDPGARIDLWRYLEELRRDSGVTILVTTHLMEEAERCDQLGILSRGELVALGSPDELKSTVGGESLTIHAADLNVLAAGIRDRFRLEPKLVAGALRLERERGHELLRDLVAAFPDDISSVTLGKPTLEDVFIHRTGHRFWEEDEAPVVRRKGR